MKEKTLMTIIRGTPGSGKSTFSKQLCFYGDYVHIEADQYFVDSSGNYNYQQSKIGAAHTWCQKTTERQISNGTSVVVSNTFTTIKELRPYFEIALKFGILPTVILMHNDFGSIHSVPDDVISKMKDRFQYDISELIDTYKLRISALEYGVV